MNLEWNDWAEIMRLTDQHGYMSGVDRMSKRVKKTGEVFTPTVLVLEMLQKMPLETFAPGKTVLDPACGDGQFLVPVKYLKMFAFDMTEEDALRDIYGVEIMRDNVDLCKMRLGGGNIVMGDTLNPAKKLEYQTSEEYGCMKSWFCPITLESFFV
jgi:type I restriction-modification system DNA methylase subunit